jgi:hypothetical protein
MSYFDTIQNFTVFDSTDANGIIYMIQHARAINPIKLPRVLSDTTRYWIDTTKDFVYGSSSEGVGYDSVLLYKLNAQIGHQWVLLQHGDESYEMARVVDKWDGNILGHATTLMHIHYYGARDSADTVGLDRYGDLIADGYGLIRRFGLEATTAEITLIGAVIDGILYGDTTLMTVKNHGNFLPASFRLHQNYPNPFNPSTTIVFELVKRSTVSLTIYDVLGKEMFTLIENKVFDAGAHTTLWNGRQRNGNTAASGIYFYRLTADGQTLSRSMILLK